LDKPTLINILGIEYSVTYVDNPAEVDIYKRESCWAQLDFWTRTIRVYDHGRSLEDIWQSLLHEVLHGIAGALHLKALGADANHDELDILALALMDVFVRNGWLVFNKAKEV